MKWNLMGLFGATTLLSPLSVADLSYRLIPDFVTKKLTVEMEFETKEGTTDLQMPSWAPGAYILGNFWKSVEGLKAQDEFGQTITVAPQAPGDTWRIYPVKSGKVKVSYQVPLAGGRFGASESLAKTAQISGPSTYMYVVDRKDERCHLEVVMPKEWKLAIGLNEAKGSEPGRLKFDAKTFDVLADNPITLGDYRELEYTSRRKKHTLAMRGDAANDVDAARVLQVTRFVTEAETDFFGGAPYDKYVWHISVSDRADGGGGLEHLSSTQIGLGSGIGLRSQSVMAHEFFHLWNVKRIRSKVLGPFDYRVLPKTGALWWLEGVTDYYASLLMFRYGWWGPSYFYKDVARNVTGVRAKPGRLEISPYDSSYRVSEANGGRGNSDGLKVSYYNTGWVLGMLLDIELRSRTQGKGSLDDVERALWNQCKNDQPGFEEGEIRKHLMDVGGPEMGPLYDQWVMKPGELPVEAQLAKVGLGLEETEEVTNDPGFTFVAEKASKGVRVLAVTAKDSGLSAKDIITSINNVDISQLAAGPMQAAFRKQIDMLKPGAKIALTLASKPTDSNRPGEQKRVEIVLAPKVTKTQVVREMPGASEAQRSLRQGWFYANRGTPKSTVVQEP